MASDKEILNDLSAPLKSFRLYGLEQAINSGSSADLLKTLETLNAGETDEECLLLFPHAIEAVKGRLQGGQAPLSKDLTATGFRDLFAKLNPASRLRNLLLIPRRLVPELIGWAVEIFQTEENPAIRGKILSIFGPFWPENARQLILEQIFGKFISLRVSSLEAIIALSPDLLFEHLPRLLREEDPRIMATAIKALARVDREEATRYIEKELLGRSPLRKLAILRVATGLEFQLVKEPLLKLLSLETGQPLLEKAGLIFHINPDPEVPFRILEIMNQADPGKLPVLQETFDGSWKIVQNSKILGDEFPTYFSNLNSAAKKNGLLKSVNLALTSLESDDEILREEGRALLSQKRSDPLFQETLEKIGSLKISQPDRKKIEEIISSEKNPTVTGEKSLGKTEIDIFDLPIPGQCRFLSSLQQKDLQRGIPIISSVLKSEKSDAMVKAVALRASMRLEIESHKDLALRWINRAEEALAAASLEYLARFDLDTLIPRLGTFHKAVNPRIRILAMQILWKQDPEQAISSILAVLKASNQRSRGMAFSALMGFNFPLIMDALVEILITSPSSEILEPVLLLFQNNPSPENLLPLYRLEKAFPRESSEQIRSVSRENISLIIQLKLIPAENLRKLQDSLPQKWQELQARNASPPKYALQKTSQSFSSKFTWMSELSESINEFAFLGLVGVGVFFMSWFAVGAVQSRQTIETKIVSGALYSGPFQIEGIIKKFTNKGRDVLIETGEKTLFQIKAPNQITTLVPGDKVKAVVEPFRQADGIIFARFSFEEKL